MNISQLLKSLTAMWPEAEWCTNAFRKYLLAESDIVAYFYSTDADTSVASENQDRNDDLFLLSAGLLTIYRLTTLGLDRRDGQTTIQWQTLQKSVIPMEQVAGVHMSWESTQPFKGDVPSEEERIVRATIALDTELPTLGTELTLPYRDRELRRDPVLMSHEVETFAEALVLQMEQVREIPGLEPLAQPEL